MELLRRLKRHVVYGYTAAVGLVAVVALYRWTVAVQSWGQPAPFATALAYTTIVVALVAASAVVERLIGGH